MVSYFVICAVGLVLLVGALIITLVQLRITGVIGRKED